MKVVGFGSRMEGARLHKDVEIRSSWKRAANEGKESGIRGSIRWDDGGGIEREVSHMLYTLFLKTNQTKTMQTKDLAILT